LQGSEEFFYQLALRQFGNMGHIKLNPPPSLRTLVQIAIDAEDTSSSGIEKKQLVDVSCSLQAVDSFDEMMRSDNLRSGTVQT
jgi:DNA mismatch repair protein MLH1